jgi:hypothetical protein
MGLQFAISKSANRQLATVEPNRTTQTKQSRMSDDVVDEVMNDIDQEYQECESHCAL